MGCCWMQNFHQSEGDYMRLSTISGNSDFRGEDRRRVPIYLFISTGSCDPCELGVAIEISERIHKKVNEHFLIQEFSTGAENVFFVFLPCICAHGL